MAEKFLGGVFVAEAGGDAGDVLAGGGWQVVMAVLGAGGWRCVVLGEGKDG